MRDPQTCDMVTAYGHPVWFDAPELTVVDPRDIQRATGNTCRYLGHLKWSLVRHLDLTSKLGQLHYPDNALVPAYNSIHDAHEIVVGDMVSGLKKYCPGYQRIEHAFEKHFHQELGLPWAYRPHKAVHHCDMRALVCEMVALNHPAGEDMIALQFGGLPTEEETELMNDVRSQSLAECWDNVWKTIIEGQGRVALLQQVEELNGERES